MSKFKLRWVGYMPVPVIYVKKIPFLNSGGFAGLCFLILIKGKYVSDKGILEHELTHIKQFWRTYWLFPLLYASHKYRLKFEVEGYKVQLRYAINYEASLIRFSRYISNNYKLSISLNDAKALLMKKG